MRNPIIPLIAAILLLAQSVAAETVQIGDNKGGIMAINSDGTFPVANVGTRIFYDAFETSFDTAVNWASPVSAGGGVGQAWSAGMVTLGTGTTAGGYSSIVTQHAFQPVPPGHLEIVKAVKLPTTLPANTEAFWGIGTAAVTPTAAVPVQEGCGFEIQAAATSALEKMYAVCFSGSTRSVIQDLSASTGNGKQPLDGVTHTYYIFFRGDFYYFAIDQLSNVVAIQRTGMLGPNVNTQPVLVEAVAGTSNPLSSLTITVAAVWVGDTGRNGTQVCDATHPWQCQAISATGGSVVAPTTGGSVSPGTAASQSDLSGCIYNSTPPTVTNGQQVATQCDSLGNARAVPADAVNFNNTTLSNGTVTNGLFSSGTITNPSSGQVVLGPIDTIGASSFAFMGSLSSGSSVVITIQESFSASGPWSSVAVATNSLSSGLSSSVTLSGTQTFVGPVRQRYIQVIASTATSVFSIQGYLRSSIYQATLTQPSYILIGLVRSALASSAAGNLTNNNVSTTSSNYLVAVPYSPPEMTWQYSTNGTPITSATTTLLNAAGAAGVRNYITGIQCDNTGALGTEVQILDGAAVIWDRQIGAVASAQPGQISLPSGGIPLRGTAATAISLKTVSGTTISLLCSVQGYQAF